jgi:hypothetical protein
MPPITLPGLRDIVRRRGRQGRTRSFLSFGFNGLIAVRVLPPAGLSQIRRRHWARWMAKPVYLKLIEYIDPLVSVVQNCFCIRSLKIDPEVSRPPCDRLAGIQYHRNATFPAQGESCQKAARCTSPS